MPIDPYSPEAAPPSYTLGPNEAMAQQEAANRGSEAERANAEAERQEMNRIEGRGTYIDTYA
jgi:hypothetical protein